MKISKISENPAKMPFVESKRPDMDYIAGLLEQCIQTNLWANRGPLYHLLADKYEKHMNVSDNLSITPCANGGIGLEAIAKFLEIKFTKPIRWVSSSFSFSNLGRGYFNDMQFVDCTDQGMLSLKELKKLDGSSFDGFIVTNVFGAWRDFGPYIDYARKTGKFMLIDNAAGLSERLPEWPYQSFSLHHTKPYGSGEGGLILSPKEEAESIYNLLNYVPLTDVEKKHWINNGKVSDIACAFQLERLGKCPEWKPRYLEQAARVTEIAAKAGLQPLFPVDGNIPATSLPFCASAPVQEDDIDNAKHLMLSKYYLPLADTPACMDIYSRLVNIPCHPNVALLTDEQLLEDFFRLTK
ncbi:MAG: DegT/DnrJ/EryC1/StrS family aminotransferase [Sneathiella sp.]|nr:DegT/DnrJ/EryC1/StrS family aminotransferase [Sneathiella sp.]